MSESMLVDLASRGVVRVSGADAVKLLGGIITNEIADLERSPAIHAGLLSPQGKILFDFFVVRAGDGFLLDVAKLKAAELAKRISMYKLRAAVVIEDVSQSFRVFAAFGDAARAPSFEGAVVYADPRLAELSWRVLVPSGSDVAVTGDEASYHARRIGLGVPEGGRDWDFGDTFPHEALFDQLKGVSFTKGCYVGQEIVSRMEHRGTARKRVVPMIGESELSSDRPEVLAGSVAIGKLGSVAGDRGLALLRLDRVAEAQAKGQALTAGGVPVRVELPAFAKFKIELPVQ